MIKNYYLLISLYVFLLPQFVSGQTFKPISDVEALKTKLANENTKLQSITSDFVQEKHLTILSEDIVSKGKFYFKKDRQIRWEYTEPYNYLIIINGDQIHIRDDKKTSNYNAGSNKMFKEINDLITNLIQGNTLNEKKKFDLSFFEDNSFYLIRMIPKNKGMKEFLSQIEMYIEKKTFTVAKLLMIEPSEDYTLIKFENKHLNETIPNNTFTIR